MIWPIIANTEVIAVSQSYAGFSGGQFKKSVETVVLDTVNHAAITKGMSEQERLATGPTVAPSFQYPAGNPRRCPTLRKGSGARQQPPRRLYKPMLAGGAKTAVLLMNSAMNAEDLTVDFAD
eukprot:gene2418-9987_t